MCGISGIYHFDGRPADRPVLERMLRHIASRGPDGEAVLLEGALGFGHRRLSIIELGEAGSQPMNDGSGTVAITYNGEIYNYRELRSYLETVGMTFRTGSDTEVLLNGYRRWGIEGLLKRIDGMYAFVIYDRRLQQLFACRDRFGEKPLYYQLDDTRFCFSSSVASIAAVTEKLSLNMAALDHYLGELCMPQPYSIWNEIVQLPPASFLSIDLRKKKSRIENYWQLSFTGNNPAGEDEILAETEALLKKAVLSRTVADVPVAFLLSSGADSGLLVSLCAQQSSQPLNTFSIGFHGHDSRNELPEARALAKKYGTNHHEIIVDPKAAEQLPALTQAFGEPFADSSAIPSMAIYSEIRKQYKVAIGGDGGDELFGGYHDYLSCYRAEAFAAGESGRLQRIGNALAYRAGLAKENTGHLRDYHALPPWRKLHREMGFGPDETAALYHPGLKEARAGFLRDYLEQAWHANRAATQTATLSGAFLHTRLLNDYLVKVDRSAMAFGLEVRSPFLSPELAAFAAGIPDALRLKNGTAKYLLKKLAARHIDPGFEKRPKRGFGIPMDAWLRGELKEYAHDTLFGGGLEKRQLFDMKQVRRLFDEHQSGKADHRHKVWALLCLEHWLEGAGL